MYIITKKLLNVLKREKNFTLPFNNYKRIMADAQVWPNFLCNIHVPFFFPNSHPPLDIKKGIFSCLIKKTVIKIRSPTRTKDRMMDKRSEGQENWTGWNCVYVRSAVLKALINSVSAFEKIKGKIIENNLKKILFPFDTSCVCVLIL